MKKKMIIAVIFTILVISCYIFIRLLPTYFIHKQIHWTYVSAIRLQEFAGKHNIMFFPKLYKSNIEKYLETAVPAAEKEMDKVIIKASAIYDDYIKNPSKELSLQDHKIKVGNYEDVIDYIELEVYIGALKITDNYLLIPFGALPTCYSDIWASAFLPYMKKYNADYSKLVELGNYLLKKQEELQQIIEKLDSYPIPKNDNKDYRMLAEFPKQGIYYYYYKDFNPTKFKKPDEVIMDDGSYTIFVYDENMYDANFKERMLWDDKTKSYHDYVDIKDEAGYMFDMIMNGVELKPKYFVRRHRDCLNSYEGKCIDICEFKEGTNLQTKYTANPWTGEIVEQMTFDNGPVGLGNICNPDWIPGMDI